MRLHPPGTGAAAPAVVLLQSGLSAPRDLELTPGNGQIRVSWRRPQTTGGSPIDSYVAYAETDAETGILREVGRCTVDPGALQGDLDTFECTITGLTNGTRYSVSVFALVGASQGPESSATTTPFGPPGAPTGVSATAGYLAAAASWTAPSDNGGSPITSYTASFALSHNPAFVSRCTTADGDTLTCSVTSLLRNTRYSVTVVATNAAGSSTASAAVTVTPRDNLPRTPINVTATAGDGEIEVAWTNAPSSPGVTSFTASAAAQGETTRKCTPGPHPTRCTITGLTNETQYSVTVVATNGAGDSLPSAAVTATPLGVPGAPTIVAVFPGSNVITVHWTAPGDDGGSPITSYTATATPQSGNAQTCTLAATATACSISPLAPRTQYSVSVVATNGIGNGPTASVTATTLGAPAAPGAVRATASDQQIAVSWSAPADTGGAAITSYTATATPQSGSVQTCTPTPATATACTITGLANGVAYTVTVFAINSIGNGPTAAAPRTVTPGRGGPIGPGPIGPGGGGGGLPPQEEEEEEEEPALGDPVEFHDVAADAWYHDHVQDIARLDITTGCATNPPRYCPDQPVTRAQMALFLYRALNLPDVPARARTYQDVGPGHYAKAAVEAVHTANITTGCATNPNRYCPDQPVTRAQMAAFLSRALTISPRPVQRQ